MDPATVEDAEYRAELWLLFFEVACYALAGFFALAVSALGLYFSFSV